MASVSVRIDDDIKEGAERVLKNIGLSMASAISIYLKQIKEKQEVPLKLKAEDFPKKMFNRKAGEWRGQIYGMTENFDEPLEDFFPYIYSDNELKKMGRKDLIRKEDI
jgi:addiction module RelB/DinJ family antitoxin